MHSGALQDSDGRDGERLDEEIFIHNLVVGGIHLGRMEHTLDKVPGGTRFRSVNTPSGLTVAATTKAISTVSGRDPQAITPALVQVPIVAPTGQAARKMLDTKFVRFWALLGSSSDWRKAGAQHPFGAHFRGYVDWIPEQYDRKTLEEALAAVPPGLIGGFFAWGTPEQVAGKLRAYGAVGVRHVGFINLQMLISRRAALYGPWATARIARLVNRPTRQ